jgi:DNA-binding MarR family transcriptional regulator
MPEFSKFFCYEMKLTMKKIERYMTQRLDEYGVNFTQSLVLFCLMEQNGQTLSEVGLMAQIENSTLTSMSDKLERMGLVEKRSDARNRRVVKLFITPLGRNVGEKIFALGLEFNQHLLGKLGELQDSASKSLEIINETVNEEFDRCSPESKRLPSSHLSG